MLTRHAQRRMRQRGFHKFDLDLILFLGMTANAHGGATKFEVTREMVQDCMRSLNRIRNGATAIIGDNGKLTTVYKDYRR